MPFYLLPIFTVGIGVTFCLTPLFAQLAKQIGAIDRPDERKIHDTPIPRLGGGALVTGFFSAALVFFLTEPKVSIDSHLMVGILAGALVIVTVGILDDLWNMPPKGKLIGQIIAATVVFSFGAQITFVNTPFSNIIPLGILAYPITTFWIVGMTNAVNLMDGLDGLASGISAIAAFTLALVALHLHHVESAVLATALLGASLGFLRYNFYPASIFLGDTGSLFLGYILATISVIGVLKSTLLLAFFIPLLILGVPIFDTAFAIIRRAKSRQPIFRPDKRHIHHRLLNIGLNQKQVVLVIYIATLCLCAGALAITYLS